MRIKIFSVLISLFTAGSLIASPQSIGTVSKSSNIFGWSLFEKIDKNTERDKNVLISPFSAYVALSLAANGAADETLYEIKSALEQQDLAVVDINAELAGLIESLTTGKSSESLKIANSVWANSDNFYFHDSYLSSLNSHFAVTDRELAFAAPFSDEETLGKINNWVSENTGGMIPEMISQLDDRMVAILLNALFFQAEWYEPFEEQLTNEMNFDQGEETIPVSMMHNHNIELAYAETAEFKKVTLSFAEPKKDDSDDMQRKRSRYEAEFIKAHNIGKLSDFNETDYNQLQENIADTRVKLGLPKFKFDYKKELKSPLIDMGVKDAFSPQDANFSELGVVRSGDNPFISSVLQKTAVEMDEKGLKAAAATAVIVSITSLPPQPTKEFFADEPFLLVLKDATTQTILFIGRIASPEWDEESDAS